MNAFPFVQALCICWQWKASQRPQNEVTCGLIVLLCPFFPLYTYILIVVLFCVLWLFVFVFVFVAVLFLWICALVNASRGHCESVWLERCPAAAVWVCLEVFLCVWVFLFLYVCLWTFQFRINWMMQVLANCLCAFIYSCKTICLFQYACRCVCVWICKCFGHSSCTYFVLQLVVKHIEMLHVSERVKCAKCKGLRTSQMAHTHAKTHINMWIFF